MKKSNLIIIISFVLVIAVAGAFMLFKKSDNAANEDPGLETVAPADPQEIPTVGVENPDDHSDSKKALFESEKVEKKEEEPREYKTMPMDDSLFIGDSRTVGLADYGKIEGAEYFSDVGMSVYNIFDKGVKVSPYGYVTLKDLLEKNEYNKIYLMLGINEAGYEVDQTVEKYEKLVDFVREKEPDAKIFVMSNLHVTNAKASGSYINNKTLNKINEGISAFAEKDNVFYLDVNELFDDNNGGLAPSKTGDGVHLYAKFYVEWGKWIVDQSAQIWEENGF